MAKNESVEFFLRFLRERFDVFRESLTEFLRAVSQEDLPKKLARAKHVQTTLDDLKRAIAANDRPPWIQSLEEKFSYYIQVAPQGQPEAGFIVLQSILAVHRDIERQKWVFNDDSVNFAIDFSAIYNEFYNASRVPELLCFNSNKSLKAVRSIAFRH